MANSKSIKPYSIGDVVSEELPFVHVLDGKQKSLKCDYCLKGNQSLKRCSKCLKMFYCNRECQRMDWFWHKNECKLFANNINQQLDDFLCRILLRLWLSINNTKELLYKKFKVFNDLYRCLNDLESHELEVKSDGNRMKEFEEFGQTFKNYGINYENEKLFKLYGQLLINIYSIIIHDSTYDNEKSGYGLYISTSVIDHSCAPNGCVIFDGIKLQVRAMKPIAANEEILVHYIPLDTNKTNRQLKLKNQYYFDCKCPKCCAEDEQTIDYIKYRSLLNQLHTTVEEGSHLKDSSQMIDELLLISEQIYGPIHPEFAAILMVVMQYQLLTPQPNYSPKQISQFIERVGRVIQSSFGESHKFYRMYKMFVNIKNMTNK